MNQFSYLTLVLSLISFPALATSKFKKGQDDFLLESLYKRFRQVKRLFLNQASLDDGEAARLGAALSLDLIHALSNEVHRRDQQNLSELEFRKSTRRLEEYGELSKKLTELGGGSPDSALSQNDKLNLLRELFLPSRNVMDRQKAPVFEGVDYNEIPALLYGINDEFFMDCADSLGRFDGVPDWIKSSPFFAKVRTTVEVRKFLLKELRVRLEADIGVLDAALIALNKISAADSSQGELHGGVMESIRLAKEVKRQYNKVFDYYAAIRDWSLWKDKSAEILFAEEDQKAHFESCQKNPSIVVPAAPVTVETSPAEESSDDEDIDDDEMVRRFVSRSAASEENRRASGGAASSLGRGEQDAFAKLALYEFGSFQNFDFVFMGSRHYQIKFLRNRSGISFYPNNLARESRATSPHLTVGFQSWADSFSFHVTDNDQHLYYQIRYSHRDEVFYASFVGATFYRSAEGSTDKINIPAENLRPSEVHNLMAREFAAKLSLDLL